MRILSLLVTFALAAPLASQDTYPDQDVLDRCLGRQAIRIPTEQVLDYTWSRRGLTVVVDGREVQTFEGLSNRLSVRADGDAALAFGSLVLLADETARATAALGRGGAEIASLTPRFPGATPQPFELRFHLRGTAARIGAAVAAAIAVMDPEPATSTDIATAEAGAHDADGTWRSAIGAAPLEALLGRKAEEKRGVALFRLPGPRPLGRGEPGFRLGAGTSIAFAGLDADALAHVDATFDEAALGGVLEQFAAHGFRLTALASASPGIDPDLVHVELHARGAAVDLARALVEILGDVGPAPAIATVPVAPPGREVLGVASGRLDAGWTVAATHPAGPARAEWVTDGEALRMSAFGDADNRTFNLLWNPALRMRDGRLAVRMRALDGRLDQGGGLIWRVQDADNYYITRFNPLEQDFRVYRVRGGTREQLQAVGELPFAADDWFTVVVETRGDHIRCTLNGAVVLDVRDTTFPDAGGIGFWSKADSRCAVAGLWFDPDSQDETARPTNLPKRTDR